MTDPIVSLDADRVAVEPGGQASVTVKITNPGSIVEGYLVEVIGEGVSEWAEAMPRELSVYPQQDANSVIVFSPPSGSGAPGGTWPFGIRVRSTEDPDASAVAEGDLDIGRVFGLQAKLLPVTSSGRWRGVHVLQVSNWGNAPVSLRLSASNPDQALGFMIRPDVIDLPLGAVATARVWAKTKSPSLRGTPTRIPFTVSGEREGEPAPQGSVPQYGGTPDRPSVDGAFNQKPILSRGTVMVATLALLGAGGAVVWALRQAPPPVAVPATYAELGTPEPPIGVTATSSGPGSVEVRWADVPNVAGYKVAQVLDDESRTGTFDVPVTNQAARVDGLQPAKSVCFAVAAVRGEDTGAFSEKACAESLPPTPTAGPSAVGPSPTPPTPPPSSTDPESPSSGVPTPTGGTGSPDPGFKGKWFAAAFWPKQLTLFDEVAEYELLRARDEKKAGLVESILYPDMQPALKRESWVLYLGPYDTESEASASCDILLEVHPSDCGLVRLDP